MDVAVVNIFDPLPGETLREGRYGTFCRALVARGHTVTWYSSDFCHARKARRNADAIVQTAKRRGYAVALAPGLPYRKNASPQRLLSHRRTARHLAKQWSSARPPDVILVSLPPPVIGCEAARWARQSGAALAVDVQDLWPETIGRFWPRGLRWLNPIVFAGMVRGVRVTYQHAAVLIGAAKGYTDHARTVAPDTPAVTLHLGVDLAAFDATVRAIETFGLSKPPGEKWLFLGGTMSAYVDLAATLDMMAALDRRHRRDIRLVVVGSGPAAAGLHAAVRQRALDRVTMMGQQSYEVFASVAVASEVGILPIKPASLVFFPNRVFDYFAAGLPIVSTIRGELADTLATHNAGLTCPAANGAALADAVESLLADRATGGPDHRQHRGAWVVAFDRGRIAADLVKVLEAACDRRTRTGNGSSG